MKKFLMFFIILLFMFIPSVDAKEITVHLFYGYTCPHCAKEKEFLSTLENDEIKIVTYEVYKDRTNNKLMYDLGNKLGVEVKSVPFTVIGGKVFQGYSDSVEENIEKTIAFYQENEYKDLVLEAINGNFDKSFIPVPDYGDTIKIPLIGDIDPKNASLTAIAIVIGFVDGFNPCAMWILIFLISMLLGTHNKKRMWTLGLTFLVTSSFVYFLFMMSWLSVVNSFIEVRWLQMIIAVIALIGSFINIRSFIRTRTTDGCEVVSDSKRKGIMLKVKKFVTEKSFILAILGIMALALTVNLIELACSAGLPLLFTQILAMNDLSSINYLFYVLVYVFFFMLDDLIIFIIAMKTFEITGISTKYSKYSHLIGGIIMFIIGLLLIFKPSWIMFNF